MKEKSEFLKKYVASVERKLNMPKDVKNRVITDFSSSIECRREAGQTIDAIIAELGSPDNVAAELNEQMKDYTYVKSPWRWVCLVLIVGCVLSLLYGGAIGLIEHMMNVAINSSLGIIGGADGPTAVFVTTSPDYVLYQIGISLLILFMAILGFYRLSRCPRK